MILIKKQLFAYIINFKKNQNQRIMKKFFYMSVLVLMAALTLTSCGSDNDKKDEPTPSSKSAAYNFTVNISQDLLDISEVTVVYKDGDGKTIREAAKSTKFTKTVNINKFPAVVGTKCEFKLKDGVQLTKEKYDLIATYDHQISINGKDPYGAKNLTFMQKEGVRPNVVAEQLSKWSGAQAYGFTIDAKGISSTTQDVTF